NEKGSPNFCNRNYHFCVKSLVTLNPPAPGSCPRIQNSRSQCQQSLATPLTGLTATATPCCVLQAVGWRAVNSQKTLSKKPFSPRFVTGLSSTGNLRSALG